MFDTNNYNNTSDQGCGSSQLCLWSIPPQINSSAYPNLTVSHGRAEPVPRLVISDTSATTKLTAEELTYLHKRKRQILRSVRGVSCGVKKHKRFRWWVMGESNEAIEAGLDIWKTFHKFIYCVRRKWDKKLQYQVVEHQQGDLLPCGRKRRHFHIITYGARFIPKDWVNDWWEKHYLSHTSKFQAVHSPYHAVSYIAGYLTEKNEDGSYKFVRSTFSQRWVFPGWISYSKAYKRKNGIYPSEEKLVSLSLLTDAELMMEKESLIGSAFTRQYQRIYDTPVPYDVLEKIYRMDAKTRVTEKEWLIETGHLSSHYFADTAAGSPANNVNLVDYALAYDRLVGIQKASVRHHEGIPEHIKADMTYEQRKEVIQTWDYRRVSCHFVNGKKYYLVGDKLISPEKLSLYGYEVVTET